MQQIYMQSNEHFQVFTTVFSPQVCRARTRYRRGEAEQMVVTTNYRPHRPDELELCQGDIVHVLLKNEKSWCFGRLQNGGEGYFPAACVATLNQRDEPTNVAPSPLKQSSVEAVTTDALGGCVGGPWLKSSKRAGKGEGLYQTLSPDSSAALSECPAHSSPGLLHRILSRSRRRSEPNGEGGVAAATNGAFEPD